jgi:RNA polymerase sigma factor (TIGR02999 family)
MQAQQPQPLGGSEPAAESPRPNVTLRLAPPAMKDPPPDRDSPGTATPAVLPQDGARLFELLGNELRRMAGRIAAGQVGHTLHPTALVNELFMRFFGGRPRSWNDEVHFMRSAAVTMRTILLDHHKRRSAKKHGGGVVHEPLDAVVHQLEGRCGGDLLGVHEALEQLAVEDQELAEYVALRFFGGRTNAEAARILGICERTGDNHWQFARSWLQRRLRS